MSLPRRLRTAYQDVLNKAFAILVSRNIDAHPPTRRLGSAYGGWTIVDGLLARDGIVYSAGVGEDVTFDLALIELYDIKIHAFDPTPRSIAWVHAQQLPPAFVLHPIGLAERDGEIVLHPPEDPAHISHSIVRGSDSPTPTGSIVAPAKRVATVMQELGHTHIDLLKMDIEGAEYSVIGDMLAANIRPKQLLVEFHHRFDEIGFHATRESIRLIREHGYKLFSVSPSGEEFGFLQC